jgi:hypothetical protein
LTPGLTSDLASLEGKQFHSPYFSIGPSLDLSGLQELTSVSVEPVRRTREPGENLRIVCETTVINSIERFQMPDASHFRWHNFEPTRR